MMTKIFDLAYEIDGDSIELEQDMGCGDGARITLHPMHLRLLAEKTGLVAPSSNLEADRTIARLARQMRILMQRIDQLGDWLRQAHSRGHENLDMETTYSFATWELASEFVHELPPEPGNAPVTQVALHAASTDGGNVGAGNPCKSGCTSPLFDGGAV